MKKVLVLFALIGVFRTALAQRITIDRLQEMLSQPMSETEENLFLIGYSFSGDASVEDSSVQEYHFSNKKNTIGTAKRVTKSVDERVPLQSYIQYITYDRREFEQLRRQMIDEQYERDTKDGLDENSNYSKGNLRINFRLSKDEYQNDVFTLTLRNAKSLAPAKVERKIKLREMLNKLKKED